MLKIGLILFVTVVCDIASGGENETETWILTDIIEDGRGKTHHFRLNDLPDDIVCRGCTASKSTPDARTSIGNVFFIMGILKNPRDAGWFAESFIEANQYFFCRHSRTACVNYKDETDEEFHEIILDILQKIEIIDWSNFPLTATQDIIDDVVQITVCEIMKSDCERFENESYNVSSVFEDSLKKLNVLHNDELLPLLTDIVHNRVIRARCYLECNTF